MTARVHLLVERDLKTDPPPKNGKRSAMVRYPDGHMYLGQQWGIYDSRAHAVSWCPLPSSTTDLTVEDMRLAIATISRWAAELRFEGESTIAGEHDLVAAKLRRALGDSDAG